MAVTPAFSSFFPFNHVLLLNLSLYVEFFLKNCSLVSWKCMLINYLKMQLLILAKLSDWMLSCKYSLFYILLNKTAFTNPRNEEMQCTFLSTNVCIYSWVKQHVLIQHLQLLLLNIHLEKVKLISPFQNLSYIQVATLTPYFY